VTAVSSHSGNNTTYYIYIYLGSPLFVTICFAMIYKNNGFEARRPKISNYKKV